MRSKNIRKLVGALVLFAALLAAFSPQATFAQPGMDPGVLLKKEKGPGLTPDQARMILNATVQMYVISSAQGKGQKEEGVKMMYALGTLVTCGGGTLLVTHDHWEYLDLKGVVQLYTAEGSKFLEMSTQEFTRSILYRDQGTMVVKFPAGEQASTQTPLANSGPVPAAEANLGDAQAVAKGAAVYITHHQPSDPMKLSLLAAEVVSIKNKKGVRVFNLKSLDGGTVVVGDSGGGLWYGGKLVGNTWLAYPVTQRSFLPGHYTETEEVYLEKSTSAQLPGNFLTIFGCY